MNPASVIRITFGSPHWFWAAALLPALVLIFLWNEPRRKKLVQKLVATRLQPQLVATVSGGKRRVRFALALAGLACVIVALARPQLGYSWTETKRKGRDVLIAIDTSKSMLAGDLAPNRLTRAKLAAHDLIDLLPGDRVGLIAFAGDAFLQAPLTIDYTAVISALDELDVNIIPRGGTNIAAAIRIAAQAFGKGESEHRALVLMSDGEELDEDAIKAAREHASEFRIFTAGVGSPQGALIPVPSEEGGTTFVKDQSGQFVKSVLDETRLSEVANAAGGFYVTLQNASDAMKEIVQRGLGQMQEREIDARTSREPVERYQWPLAAGLVLLTASQLIGERKRVRQSALPVAICLWMQAWSGFAGNPGVELYGKQNYQEALSEFQKQLARQPKSEPLQFDAGTAAYQLGDYDHALEAFGKAVTAKQPAVRAPAEYNLGNTLFQRGAKQEKKEPKLREWRNALQHYDEALKLQPTYADAKANRDTVRKMIEELEKPQPPQEDKKEEEKDEKDKDEEKKDSAGKPQEQNKNDKPQPDKKKDSQRQSPSQSKNQADQPEEGSKENQEADQNAKNQQKQSDQKQPQEEKKSGSPQKEESAKNEAGKSEKKDEQKSEEPKAGGEQAANSPAPAPSPSQEKPSGEIKAQPSEQKKGDEATPAEAMAEAKPGEMSEAQARALVESLRGDDQRVQLNQPAAASPVLKDW